MGLGAVCDENKKRQQCDQSYRCGLCENNVELEWPIWSSADGYKNKICEQWLMVQIQSTMKTKLRYRDRSNRVWSMMKTREENDVTYHISLVYIETKTKLLGPIYPGVICYENRTG